MANRRPQNQNMRRDFGRNDQRKNFSVSPWQGGGPGAGLQNLLPLGGATSDALTLATNLIQMLQPRPNPVPSLLDMPVRRDFGPNMGPRFNQGGFMPPNRMGMGNQNFRRSGNFNRSGGGGNMPYRNRNQNQPRTQSASKPYVKKEADKPKTVTKESDEAKEIKKEPEESTEGETTETKDGAKSTPKDDKNAKSTRYDDIAPALLKCHICNKSMWDGRSFENHLSGRAHAIMMQKTAESYALTADTMRQEFKIREMKRTRKSGGQTSRDFYCAMCDMYAPDGAVHRTTIGHRKLKKYLHPACINCHKEMPTRIELDEHRLTAEHLRNIQDKQDFSAKPKPEMLTISTLSTEQSYVRDDKVRHRRHHDRDTKEGDGDKEMEVDGEDKKPAKEADKEDTVIDFKEGDDLSNVSKAQWPAYKLDRGVGRSFLEEFKCFQCKLCHKLLDTEETAEVHLKTWRHHQLFVKMLQEKTKKEEIESNGKRHLNAEDDGNSKRRRTSDDDEKESAETHEVEQEEAEPEANGEVQEGDHGDADEEMPEPSADQLEDWDNNAQGWEDDKEEELHLSYPEEQEEEQADPEPVAEPEPEPEPSPEPAVPQMVPAPEEYAPSPVTPSQGKTRGVSRGGRARRARR